MHIFLKLQCSESINEVYRVCHSNEICTYMFYFHIKMSFLYLSLLIFYFSLFCNGIMYLGAADMIILQKPKIIYAGFVYKT